MHSLSAPSPSMLLPHLTLSFFPPTFFSLSSPRKVQRFAILSEPGSVLKKGNCNKGLCWSWSRFPRRCKDSVDDFSSLEAEILEFMQSSGNSGAFPTKEELIAGGRVDLAEAIANKGGWLAYGWDLNQGSLEIDDFGDGGGSGIDGNATRASGVASSSTSSSANSSQPAQSVGIEAQESGIEGILNRLEKQRSSFLGLGFGEKEDSISSNNNEDKEERDLKTTTDAVGANPDNSSRPSSLHPASGPLSGFQIKLDQHRSQSGPDDLRNSLKPEMWRSWIIQRSGFSDADFEAAEIVPSETQKEGVSDVSGRSEILKTGEFSCEPINRETGLSSLDEIGNANHNDIKSRIQHLESQLSSALHLLRSSTNKVTMPTEPKNSSDDLAKLSDAWEFQENEIMNAQDKLRSLRAKLAVLEGKMAMAIMYLRHHSNNFSLTHTHKLNFDNTVFFSPRDAHKVVEEKQKKINNAYKALKILKTTCIVWPNTASEVFLTGSFDGWSTQRKMEKSSSGVFSVCLQLYPGKYEIKFIVDGEWKIDPLRPIVKNNGYENNLLVIHG